MWLFPRHAVDDHVIRPGTARLRMKIQRCCRASSIGRCWQSCNLQRIFSVPSPVRSRLCGNAHRKANTPDADRRPPRAVLDNHRFPLSRLRIDPWRGEWTLADEQANGAAISPTYGAGVVTEPLIQANGSERKSASMASASVWLIRPTDADQNASPNVKFPSTLTILRTYSG